VGGDAWLGVGAFSLKLGEEETESRGVGTRDGKCQVSLVVGSQGSKEEDLDSLLGGVLRRGREGVRHPY